MAMVRLQTGLASGSLVAKIISLAENPALHRGTWPDGHKTQPGLENHSLAA